MSTDFSSGFETGFSGVSTIGSTSIQTASYGTPPTEGTSQALLTNGVGSVSDNTLENFLELSFGRLDSLGNGNATEGSALRVDNLLIEAGQFVSFDWNFLTNEFTPTFFNDFAFASITPTGTVAELADTNSVFVFSPTPFNEETGYRTFEFQFATAGTYSLGVGIVDVGDSVVDSGLLVDNLRVFSQILGTDANDFLNGTSRNERIRGGAGNDVINGNGGHDELLGEAGNDTIAGSSSTEIINGGSDNDTIYGNGGRDTLIGGDGNDLIYGSADAERILGGEGDDLIFGNGGNDVIDSGAGFDTVSLGSGAARVALAIGNGFDVISNFQLGATRLVLSNLGGLSFNTTSAGTEIFQSGDLLAVVQSQTANTFSNNFNSIFATA